MMLTMAVELPTTIMKAWVPSRAMLSSTTRLVKSIQALELDGLIVMVALVPKSASVSINKTYKQTLIFFRLFLPSA